MSMRSFAPMLSLALLGAFSPASRAEMLQYGIDFTVSYYSFGSVVNPAVAIGDVYTGTFTVDSAILASDGLNKAGTVGSFTVTMENTTWTMGDSSSSFGGFRGPGGLFSSSPGFDVVGGQITNLRGGVYGTADFPWVDFSVDTRAGFVNNPACPGPYCGNAANMFAATTSLGSFGGTMTVHAISAPVPEPETYAMALLGAGILGASLRRRRSSVAA